MPDLPTGTVTFLFTDIEGSTKLWERCPEAMRLALARHDVLLREAIEKHHGYVFKTVGDAFCAAFPTAPDALNAALEAHLDLLRQEWGETGPIRVRMGLHTGEAEERDSDYFGQTLNRVARLQGVGHGQQTLISQATYELVSALLPESVTLDDMGMHRLKDLASPEHVWQLLHPSLPSEFPPLKSLDYLPTNLPQQITSFIGREKEMAEVKDLLEKTRLLTLTGSGGTGKTRLSLQIGADLLEDYKDGVWLVELAALSDPSLVPQTVATALNIREEPGRLIVQTLTDSLKDKALLLLLDNCEHLLSAVAQLADTLLKRCPHISIIASSREGLEIAGELKYRVPSLSLPDPKQFLPTDTLHQFEAVQLFMERALFQQPSFTLTERNAPGIVSICQRLDGIPLAIELAVARVRSLPIEEINTRLDNRFRLLTGGSRTALPRHQTLRALMDWSYDLLSEQEKILLHHLSVFAGGWTLKAAETVCEGIGCRVSGVGENPVDPHPIPNTQYPIPNTLHPIPNTLHPIPLESWEILDLLTSLVDRSLVVYEEREGKGRYRLLETIRQYTWEKLEASGEMEPIQMRHLGFYLALAEEAEPKLTGPEQATWLNRLETEHDNLRAALDGQAKEPGLRIAGAIWRFWYVRGYFSEGRSRLNEMLSKTEGLSNTAARAKALHAAGSLAFYQGEYVTARALYEESLVLLCELGDKSGVASLLGNLGNVAYCQRDYETARRLLEENLMLHRELGDRLGIANSFHSLGNLAKDQGDYPTARRLYEESLVLIRESGNKQSIASLLNNLGNVAYSQGDYSTARTLYEESLVLLYELGDKRSAASSLNNLGVIASDRGDYAAARTLLEENLMLHRELGDNPGIANALGNLGMIAYAQEDYTNARTLYEESLTLQRELGDKWGVAVSLNNLGNIAHSEGEYWTARTLQEESLALLHELGDKRSVAYSLEGFAALAAAQGQVERAGQTWGAAEALRENIQAPLTPSDRAEYDSRVAAARNQAGAEAFDAYWEKGRTMTMEQAISYALLELLLPKNC